MATEAVQAFFIHKRVSGDTSLRVRFLTQEFGMVDALYKGARMPKKQAILQPFMQLWLALDVRHDWYYVRQLESEVPSIVLSGHTLFAGLYLNEILHGLLKPFDAHPSLFLIYINTLHGLSNASDRLEIELILRRFERALLSAVGYAFSLTHEATSDRLIEPSLRYQFRVGSGFVLSKEGFLGAHLLALADDSFDEDRLRTAKIIMRQAIVHAMDGREIHSRKLY